MGFEALIQTVDDMKKQMSNMENNISATLKTILGQINVLRKENAALRAGNHSPILDSNSVMPENNVVRKENAARKAENHAPISDSNSVMPENNVVRKENAARKTKKQAPISDSNSVMPENNVVRKKILKSAMPITPFNHVHDFSAFEEALQLSSEMQEKLINEFEGLHTANKNPEKYLRTCWRKIFSEELAELYCWKGTATRQCIRIMATTTTLRTAFQRKCQTESGAFERITQKHFQYAQERQVKKLYYRRMKKQKLLKQEMQKKSSPKSE